ncbi:MAG: T3SS effector HopA1 family protein [Geminicoccaceae bacterium]
MDNYQADLLPILSAVTVASPTAFTFAGTEIRCEGTPPDDLPTRLQSELYQHAYCRRFDGERGGQASGPAAPPDGGLIEPLSRANATVDRWESGWRMIRHEGNGAVWASKGETTRLFQPGQYAAPAADGGIAVHVAREGRQLQPGFYHAFGDRLADALDDRCLLRLYWNVKPTHAPELLGELTRCLNAFHLPFQLKCLNSEALYPRADALVLYVGRRFHRLLLPLMIRCHRRLAHGFGEDTPLFSKKLAPGLGLADDPGDGQSFGMHRMGLVAAALCQAHAAGRNDVAGKLQIVAAMFAQQQLDLSAPYLRPGGRDDYIERENGATL